MASERWQAFFQEGFSVVTAGERHYGVCNANYSAGLHDRKIRTVNSIMRDHSKWSIR